MLIGLINTRTINFNYNEFSQLHLHLEDSRLLHNPGSPENRAAAHDDLYRPSYRNQLNLHSAESTAITNTSTNAAVLSIILHDMGPTRKLTVCCRAATQSSSSLLLHENAGCLTVWLAG